jgi:CHASE2 domain-containing sensor protein
MIVLFVSVLLHIFHKAENLREVEDTAMDWIMILWAGTVFKEPTIPVGWIDIDDKTYLKWKEPLYVPRERLAHLIDFALQTGPKMVVVDIDLAQRNHGQELDDPVIKVLKTYVDGCKNKPLASDECPPVIMLASLRTFESDLPVQRGSYLDKYVEDSHHLFWASPLFDRDRDQTIRRWRIWESVRHETDNRLMALPSIQLLAAILLTSHKGTLERLQNCLDAVVLKGHKTTSGHEDIDEELTRCSVNLWERLNASVKGHSMRKIETLDLSGDRVARRVVYTIPWQERSKDASEKTIPTVMTFEGKERLLMSRVSARSVENVDGEYGSADLQDRVVFIGGSFSDSRDVYLSPLGEMPGVLVLINALHSLLQHGEIEDINLELKLLINVLLIALLSIAFSVWNSFWGKIVAGFCVIILLVPLSIVMFGFGFWLDFAIPLLTVQIYQIVAEWGHAARRVVTGIDSQ